MNQVSVVIITRNESANIERCLRSVAWAEEIVVVDTGSVDGTPAICQAMGCRVIEAEWQGFGLTKRLAVDMAANDWIFSIDADEEATPELSAAISIILAQPKHNSYQIKRRTYYLGKLIKHSGWHRDYPLRLFNRLFGNFNDKPVHEFVEAAGSSGTIDECLYHYSYPTITAHIAKMNRYSDLSATAEVNAGKTCSFFYPPVAGLWKFIKMFVIRGGVLDGWVGFILALNSAFGVYLKYLKIWEKSRH